MDQGEFFLSVLCINAHKGVDISPAEREMQLRQELFDAAWTECSGHIEVAFPF